MGEYPSSNAGHTDRCLPSTILRKWFQKSEAPPTPDAVAKFVASDLNDCTEVKAAQEQIVEWTRQRAAATAKRRKAEQQGPIQRPRRAPTAARAPSAAIAPTSARVLPEAFVFNGKQFPLDDPGPRPVGLPAKQKNPCKKCNQWGHTQNMNE